MYGIHTALAEPSSNAIRIFITEIGLIACDAVSIAMVVNVRVYLNNGNLKTERNRTDPHRFYLCVRF